jgi:hypothetical protein
MSDVEDYPGPTKGHEEKMGHEEDLAKADESMVTPPAKPQRSRFRGERVGAAKQKGQHETHYLDEGCPSRQRLGK